MYSGKLGTSMSVKWELDRQRAGGGDGGEILKNRPETFGKTRETSLQGTLDIARNKGELSQKIALGTFQEQISLSDTAQKIKLDAMNIDRQKSDIQSKTMTEIYLNMIKRLQEKQGMNQQDAINTAGEFVRQYGEKIQQAQTNNSDPLVLRREIKSYREAFLKNLVNAPHTAENKPEKTATRTPDTTTPDTLPEVPLIIGEPVKGEISLSAEDKKVSRVREEGQKNTKTEESEDAENEEADKDISVRTLEEYATIREKELDFLVDHGFAPSEAISGELSPDKREYATLPHEYVEAYGLNAEKVTEDSMDRILSARPGEEFRMNFPSEGGIAEMGVTKLPDGAILIEGNEGLTIRIDAREDQKQMLTYYQEILKTPIVRRLLFAGVDQFDKLRKSLAQSYPIVDTNPEGFIDIILRRIRDKVLESDKVKNAPENEKIEQLWSTVPDRTNIEGNLVNTQSFLINHRKEFLESLFIAGLIPRDGVRRLHPDKLL